jgi:hypothetical protein
MTILKTPPINPSIKSYSIDPTNSNDDAPILDVVEYRPDGISALATLINFLKVRLHFLTTIKTYFQGMVGPACLSLPLAFKYAGLWTAIVLIFVFGFLNNYCMLQLVRSSQCLSRKAGRILDYSGVAYEACAQSFHPLRKFKYAFK